MKRAKTQETSHGDVKYGLFEVLSVLYGENISFSVKTIKGFCGLMRTDYDYLLVVLCSF